MITVIEDITIQVFTEFNLAITGTGYDPELAKYKDVEYKEGDTIEGEFIDVKGKYLNILFSDGTVGVGVKKDSVTKN
tara:strand:- start:206 stop:436 length:231 start_codon:yes stop_codon:yes gene_type:complete